MNIIITSGGMKQRIDPVRSIVNSSTGALAFEILKATLENNHVFYLYGPKCKLLDDPRVTNIAINGPIELYDTMTRLLKEHQIGAVVNAMAVADYVPVATFTKQELERGVEEAIQDKKIDSSHDELYVKLKRAPKTLDAVKAVSPATFLVGFKLLSQVEDQELIAAAMKMKNRASADLVVANDLYQIRSGQPHRALLVGSNVQEVVGKPEIAKALARILADLNKAN